ncbi:MAG TPA: hypothetical protein VK563_16465 [Puia sp.]|nr:hypothetical protein [Puia sp.]
MIDRLLWSDENITRTSFRINRENIFAEDAGFLECGLMENIAQTAAAGAGYLSMMSGKPVLVGYIGSVKNLEIAALPAIDDELITETTIMSRVFGVAVISGKVLCKGLVIAQCEMRIFLDQSE